MFSQVPNPYVRYALKRYAIKLLTTISSNAAFQFWEFFRSHINNKDSYHVGANLEGEELTDRLIDVMQRYIGSHRESHTPWETYRVVQWYIWCADNLKEIGFDPIYADELAAIRIPGNPKGEAVSQEDPRHGPLDRTLELPLLRDALQNDRSQEFEHLQEKAALALCLAFGRNPLNLSWLNESDFYDLAGDIEEVESCYMIAMPRIKKRHANPRQDTVNERIDSGYAQHVEALIDANQSFNNFVMTDTGTVAVERPLFRLPHPNSAETAEGAELALRLKPPQISALLKSFVDRHEIESPLTGERLNVTPRRLRYTLATALVEEGISRRELAKILDHSDQQHVEVYFELAQSTVRHLDAAMARGMAGYFDYFKGHIIDDESEAVNGERPDKHVSFVGNSPTDQTEIGVCGQGALCNLDPPFSCYLCPLFQPYRHADHRRVLDLLTANREARLDRYETNRLGVQLDDVILAVGRVVEACEEGGDAE